MTGKWWLREGTSGGFRDVLLCGPAEQRGKDPLLRLGEDEESQVRAHVYVYVYICIFNHCIYIYIYIYIYM